MSVPRTTLASTAQDRAAQFKNRGTFRTDDLRRRRDDQLIEIRRQSRQEGLAKRRNLDDGESNIPTITASTTGGNQSDETASGSQLSSGQGQRPNQQPQHAFDSNAAIADGASQIDDAPRRETIAKLVEGLFSEDIRAQYDCTMQVRRIVSNEINPPIQEIVNAGAVPRLVFFLGSIQPDLQFEAAWALTNVASGTSLQTKSVVDAGAIPVLVYLLGSTHVDTCEQAIWALGNIAGESQEFRDLVLSHNVVQPLVHVIESFNSDRISLLRTAAWLVDNLCRGKHVPPPWEHVSGLLPTIARLVYCTDHYILTDICWALSYLTDGDNKRIQEVIDTGVCRRVVELLEHQEPCVVTPSLRVVGNIVTGNDYQTQVILNCNALPSLQRALYSPSDMLTKEACWAISNITAGNTEQLRAVVDAGVFPRLIQIMTTGEVKSRREACWAVANAAVCGPTCPELATYLAGHGAIKPFCDMLTSTRDVGIVQVAMDAIEGFLRADDAIGTGSRTPFLLAVEAANGPAHLTALLQSTNTHVYTRAARILDTYFTNSEEVVINDDDDDQLMSANNNNNSSNEENGNGSGIDANGAGQETLPAQQQFNFQPSSSGDQPFCFK